MCIWWFDNMKDKSQNKNKLAKCRVEYLGRDVPLQTNVGVQATYGPLNELFKKGLLSTYQGSDSWLRVYRSGIAIHFIKSKKVDFIPMANLDLCAALKCYDVETDDITGEQTPIFGPLHKNSESKQPALFAMIVRRPWGVKVLDCLIFTCRNDDVALSLVTACHHAYNDEEGWNKPLPSAEDIIKEDNKSAKKAKKNSKKQEKNQSQLIYNSDGAYDKTMASSTSDINVPSRAQSLPDGPNYYPRPHVPPRMYFPVMSNPNLYLPTQSHMNPYLQMYTRNPYSPMDFQQMSAEQKSGVYINAMSEPATIDRSGHIPHYMKPQKEFSINGIVMDRPSETEIQETLHERTFSVNGQVMDRRYEVERQRRLASMAPDTNQPIPMHGQIAYPVPRQYHSVYNAAGMERPLPFANITLPPEQPTPTTTGYAESSATRDSSQIVLPPPPTKSNVFKVRNETYSGRDEDDMRQLETQVCNMGFDAESIAGTIPKRIHATPDDSPPPLVSAGMVAFGHTYSVADRNTGPVPTIVSELVPTEQEQRSTVVNGTHPFNRSSVHVVAVTKTTHTKTVVKQPTTYNQIAPKIEVPMGIGDTGPPRRTVVSQPVKEDWIFPEKEDLLYPDQETPSIIVENADGKKIETESRSAVMDFGTESDVSTLDSFL